MDALRSVELSDQEFGLRVRAAGLKATRPRLLVMGVLRERGGHMSADEIVDALQAQGNPLRRGSVYGVVAALLTHGLLMMTDVGPGRALYELADRWHHHFVCRVCGAIEDVACVVGAKPCLEPEALEGEIDEAQVIFRGRCRPCIAAGRTAGSLELRREQPRAKAISHQKETAREEKDPYV
jgi:Fe2+ or Zn2+ uptake regulation protein